MTCLRFGAGLVACLAAPVAAQATVHLAAGATVGTSIVHDQIVVGRDIGVRPGVAPSLDAGVTVPTGGGYRVGLDARIDHASMQYSELGRTSDLGSYTTVSVVALVDGPLAHEARWQVGGGRISYRPADRTGIFAQGGASFWMFAAGASWSHPVRRGLSVLITARYDLHQFITPALRHRDFQQSEGVNRLGLFAGFEHTL
jgi:hypothetical protein